MIRRVSVYVRRNMWRSFYLLLILALLTSSVSCRKLQRDLVPKFLETPRNVTVHVGELAVLRCRIQFLGPKTVVWRKSTEESPLTVGKVTFTPKGEVSVDFERLSESQTKWDLLIKNVKPFHAGVYACQIAATEFSSHYVVLEVIDKPIQREPAIRVTGAQYVNKFNDIILTCNATGKTYAPDDVEWFFNGNRIHKSNPIWLGRIEISKHRSNRVYVSKLIIRKARMEDQGSYLCRSSTRNFGPNINALKVHILDADPQNPNKNPRDTKSDNYYTDEQNGTNSGGSIRLTRFHKFIILLYIILSYS